jgi:hypothetical protein
VKSVANAAPCGCSSMAEQKLPKLAAAAVFRRSILKIATLSPDRAPTNLKTDKAHSFARRSPSSPAFGGQAKPIPERRKGLVSVGFGAERRGKGGSLHWLSGLSA